MSHVDSGTAQSATVDDLGRIESSPFCKFGKNKVTRIKQSIKSALILAKRAVRPVFIFFGRYLTESVRVERAVAIFFRSVPGEVGRGWRNFVERVFVFCRDLSTKATRIWQNIQIESLRLNKIAGRNWRRWRALHLHRRNNPVILFLAPEAGLWPFFASHALLARVMADAGHSAIMLSCRGLQPTCSAKFAMRVKPTSPGDVNNAACAQCLDTALRVGHEYKLTDFPLETLLTDLMKNEISNVMDAHAAAPWRTTYDGIEFGAACLGEALRDRRKLSVEEMTEEDHALLWALLYSSLAVYLALKVLASRFNIQRIAYFGDYAYWLPPQVFATRHGIPLTHVSHAYNRDIDRRYLSIRPGHGVTHMLAQVDRWNQYRGNPINPQVVADIADGSLFRLRGHGGASTYSPNWMADQKSVLTQLGLAPGQKVIVAYSSSTDEVICNREFQRVLGFPYEHGRKPFADQSAWFRAVIAWVGERKDLRLILRLHPRMGIGHRHSNVASQYLQLKNELETLPANVAVVWPESELSSYNIAEIADLTLTAWSSIGLEVARFGIPIIATFPKIGPFPTGSFVGFEETAEGYFQAIERDLDRPPAIETVIEAFRWTHFLHWSPLIDVSDVTPEPDYPGVPPYRRPKSRDIMLRIMVAGEDLESLNMARLPRGPGAFESERAAVIAAMEKFIVFFMTGGVHDCYAGIRIKMNGAGSIDPAANSSDTRVLLEVHSDKNVSLSLGSKEIRRYSPLVHRLACLIGENNAYAAKCQG